MSGHDDGDGNRVAKTVNGATTYYLVDNLNPTGLPQVMEELSFTGAVVRRYTYGLGLIAQDQIVSNAWTPSFYETDGAGSVRQLTNSAAAITDSYEFDAFGNEVNLAGTGYPNTTGTNNIAIGFEAGYSNPASASYNIDIGYEGNASDTGDVIRIGTQGTQSSFYAAGIDGEPVSGGTEVYINSYGQMGTVNSSIRFKKDVRNMDAASSAIYRLRPVTFRYKQPYSDGSDPVEYGLIAEEVAKVYPDLVVKGADGQIQTVQYQKLTPMMLNELQKQHQLVEEQQAKIEQLEKQLAALPALEKRLTALEAARPSGARLEARLTTK